MLAGLGQGHSGGSVNVACFLIPVALFTGIRKQRRHNNDKNSQHTFKITFPPTDPEEVNFSQMFTAFKLILKTVNNSRTVRLEPNDKT